MAKYLSIIDTAYRANIEEQDDPHVWFTQAMKNGGAEVSILLRGDAVTYVARGQDASGLSFGSRTVKGPNLTRDLKAVVDKHIALFVVADDLVDRGIATSALLPGVELVQRKDVARLIESHDRLISW